MANPNAKQHVCQKVKDAFTAMDTDGSGKVSMGEFIKYCRQIKGMENIAEEFMKGDMSGDMQLTLEELDALVNRIPPDQINESHVAQLFKQVDANNDGDLDREEFTALMTSQGYSASCIDGTLKCIGGDDGKISLQEFLTAWRENEKK